VKEISAASEGRIDFLCECGDDQCTASISLTPVEYERLRSDPMLFGLRPGHSIPDVEDVVAEDGTLPDREEARGRGSDRARDRPARLAANSASLRWASGPSRRAGESLRESTVAAVRAW
jgi:hypothetical protein